MNPFFARVSGFRLMVRLSVALSFVPVFGILPPRAVAQDQQVTPAPQPGEVPGPAPAPNDAPPPPANFKNLIPSDRMAFLRDYANRPAEEIVADKRFQYLERQITPPTRYFYHFERPLSEARDETLSNQPLPITVRDQRYVLVGSAGGANQHMFGRGFLWFDIQTGVGLGGIYFFPTNGEPTPTLAIYSRQLTDTSLSIGQLPDEFLPDFVQWAQAARVRLIAPRYFIPYNSRKYVLIHDEDYCAHPEGVARPEGCEEMQAQAADVDMNAAYFMQQTRNASDATAYMLDRDQVEWLAVRDRTCAGPNGVACRIRITSQRTAVLTGHPVPPPRRVPLPIHR